MTLVQIISSGSPDSSIMLSMVTPGAPMPRTIDTRIKESSAGSDPEPSEPEFDTGECSTHCGVSRLLNSLFERGVCGVRSHGAY